MKIINLQYAGAVPRCPGCHVLVPVTRWSKFSCSASKEVINAMTLKEKRICNSIMMNDNELICL